MTAGRRVRNNAVLTAVAVTGIVVVVNALGFWIFGRADLTESSRYSLSAVSREAVAALPGLDVQVYASRDLPTSIVYGGKRLEIKGFDRELLDRLSEYRSWSSGGMTVEVVRDDVEERARKAGLELFTGKEAELEGGVLEFRKYALGAVFSYRDQIETLPMVTDPDSLEFEVTRILTRLKDKYEKSRSIEGQLAAARRIRDAIGKCAEAFEKLDSAPERVSPGIDMLSGGGNVTKMERYAAATADLSRACSETGAATAAAAGIKGSSKALDSAIHSARLFQESVDRLLILLQSRASQAPDEQAFSEALEKTGRMMELARADTAGVIDSPGRKAVAFMCGHGEFCPFSDPSPLVDHAAGQAIAARNPSAAAFLNAAMRIQSQINTVNDGLRVALFESRGLDVRLVQSGQPIPDDVEALVIFGPEKPLPEIDRYRIDQFLLSGRSVIVFVNAWDIALWNINDKGDFSQSIPMDESHVQARPSNISLLLENYGIRVGGDLLVGLKSFADISAVTFTRYGDSVVQGRRNYPYPLLPHFDNLDRTHVLVRNMSGLVLPWATSLEIVDRPGNEATFTRLVASSRTTASMRDGVDVLPEKLIASLGQMKPADERPVAVAAAGVFKSAFNGPPPTDSTVVQPLPAHRSSGEGRLLVIGSSMGLENLSAANVFEGFSLSRMTSGMSDFESEITRYAARFQNWQVRLSQIAGVVQSNMDFVFNCLDWGVQNDALVDIRSKSSDSRPIARIGQTAEAAVEAAFIAGIPLLFAAIGLIRYRLRRRRV